MTEKNTEVIRSEAKPKLITKLAERFEVAPEKLLDTLKDTAFKQPKDGAPITNEQMMALLVVANEYQLNPFTKQIYAFPDKHNGIVPVVGVDGWSAIINSHPEHDGLKFEETEDSCTCIIYRKDRSMPRPRRNTSANASEGRRRGVHTRGECYGIRR